MDATSAIAPLRARISGGVAAAAREALPGDRVQTLRIDGAAETALATGLKQLYTVRTGSPARGDVQTWLDETAGVLARYRTALVAVLFCQPGSLAGVATMGGRLRPELADHWLGLCWLAEAAWQAVNSCLTGPDFAVGDRDLLYPLAARLRFLVLSEPMRHRGEPPGGWPPNPGHPAGPGFCGRAFGVSSWPLFVGRCREARRLWRGCLDSHQEHPYLASATPRQLEQELDALVFRAGTVGVLGLSHRDLHQPAPLTAEDESQLARAVEQHLLPRFALLRVARTANHAPTRTGRAARGGLDGLVVAAFAVAAGLAAGHHAAKAAAVAGLCYLLIGAGTVAFEQRWAAQWLLRIPAASTVGVIALISFLPEAWLAGRLPDRAGPAATALVVAAYGYLLVEARNHGVARRAALVRSAAVAAVGAGHAFLVALIGLVAVGPAFTTGLAAVWSAPTTHHPGPVLLLATAWCLAAGVFSQILWDDRPITAPLAHLTWRAAT